MNTTRPVRTVFTEAGAVLQDTKNGASFTINVVGSTIWQHLTEGATRDQIVDRLSSEFSVTKDQIKGDVDEFIEKLQELGLLLKTS